MAAFVSGHDVSRRVPWVALKGLSEVCLPAQVFSARKLCQPMVSWLSREVVRMIHYSGDEVVPQTNLLVCSAWHSVRQTAHHPERVFLHSWLLQAVAILHSTFLTK